MSDPPDFEKNFSKEDPTPKTTNLEILQSKIDSLSDAQLEERFIFGLITTILLNVIFFSALPEGWGGPIAILILELILLFVLAKRLGIEEVSQLIDKLLNRFG